MGEVSAGAVWVEVLSRHREVVARHRFGELPIRIGRAYDNDLVVDDPHVAAHHLRIARNDEGRLVAEDLGTRNGLLVERKRVPGGHAAIDGERALRIGNTWLRVRTAEHAVPAERALVRRVSDWPLALACLAGAIAVSVLEIWLGETGKPKAITYFGPLFVLVVALMLWTLAWGVATRVFTGHTRFGTHFLIASAGILVLSTYDPLAQSAAFALSWTWLTANDYVVGWLVLAAVCAGHLRVIGPSHLPAKVGATALLAAAGIAMQTLTMRDFGMNSMQAETLQRLEPPFLRIAAPETSKAFFADSAALKASLDRARTDEPVSDAPAWMPPVDD